MRLAGEGQGKGGSVYLIGKQLFSPHHHLPRHGGGDEGGPLLAEEVDAGLDVIG